MSEQSSEYEILSRPIKDALVTFRTYRDFSKIDADDNKRVFSLKFQRIMTLGQLKRLYILDAVSALVTDYHYSFVTDRQMTYFTDLLAPVQRPLSATEPNVEFVVPHFIYMGQSVSNRVNMSEFRQILEDVSRTIDTINYAPEVKENLHHIVNIVKDYVFSEL